MSFVYAKVPVTSNKENLTPQSYIKQKPNIRPLPKPASKGGRIWKRSLGRSQSLLA